jgi:hypothetical protein
MAADLTVTVQSQPNTVARVGTDRCISSADAAQNQSRAAKFGPRGQYHSQVRDTRTLRAFAVGC